MPALCHHGATTQLICAHCWSSFNSRKIIAFYVHLIFAASWNISFFQRAELSSQGAPILEHRVWSMDTLSPTDLNGSHPISVSETVACYWMRGWQTHWSLNTLQGFSFRSPPSLMDSPGQCGSLCTVSLPILKPVSLIFQHVDYNIPGSL